MRQGKKERGGGKGRRKVKKEREEGKGRRKGGIKGKKAWVEGKR